MPCSCFTACASTGPAAPSTGWRRSLRRSDRVVPFHLVNEATPQRYLTGSDLDIESMQPIGDALWFGDEFGP